MGKYRVLITSRSFSKTTDHALELLKKNNFQVVYQPGPFKEAQLIDKVKDIDAMIVGADEVSEKVINGANKLKVISMHGSGVDRICLDAATKKKIIVTNVPGGNAEAVADLTWAFILSLARNIIEADQSVKRGEWRTFLGIDVFQKTLGIIGMGNIGKAVARRSKGFEMNILAYDIIKDKEFAQKLGVTYTSLDTLLKESDYITIHVPLTKETYELINAEKLKLMKETAFLINMSRGAIVNEEDLAKFVLEGKIAGAATDVFSIEPPATDNPLLRTPGIITTPHMGARSYNALNHISLKAAQNVIDVLNGNLANCNIVNP